MKRRIIMLLMILLIALGVSVGVYAFTLVDYKKSDGTLLKYRNSNEVVQIPSTYDIKDTDFRGVWLSHLVSDIPSYTSKTQYMTEMNKVFDVLEYYHINALIFHIRTHNNALYKSSLNPVASYYRNVNFDDWDPIQWIISECHKRGIEFHAWMNPYRLTTSFSGTVQEYAATQPSYNIASNPDMILKSGNSMILNPGEPVVRQFLVDTCMEVIENYDVDAIHFDDYFYISGVDDTVTRNKYNTSNLTIDDFRREQVDLFIENLHNSMETYNLANNRAVQLGISPSGIYNNAGYVKLSDYKWDSNGNLTYPLGSNTSGFAHYGDYLYSDTKKWVDEEWIDYILPQTYWGFEHPVAGYAELIDWWSQVVKYKDVNLYSGMGLYMAVSSTNTYSWQSSAATEALNQVLYATKYPEVKGHAVYSYKHLAYAYNQTSTIIYNNFSKVKENAWTKPSILPEVRTYNPITLGNVQNLGISNNNNTHELSFTALSNAKFYVIYRSNKPLTYSASEVIDVIGKADSNIITYTDTTDSNTYYYGIKPMSVTNTLGASSSISTTEASQLAVTFKNYDGSIVKVDYVDSGSSATAPSAPTRIGYTFTGWDKDFSNVTSNMEVTALFTVNQYQVTFLNYDGQVIQSSKVTYGQNATPPTVPSREGYTFTGWDKDYNNITGNVILTAQYTPLTYEVVFKDYNGQILSTSTVGYNENATAPSTPSRVGYTFTGWDKSYTNVKNNLTITALYQVNQYTVTFKDGSTVIGTQKVNHGENAQMTAPEKVGYTFKGWDHSLTNITSDLVINAIYEITKFNVTFRDVDDTVIATIVVNYGEDATAPNDPIREGYQFKGWDKGFTNVTSDLVVNATYEGIYKIIFMADDVLVLEENNFDQFSLPEIPTKEGYDKVAPVWNITDFSNITEDTTVTAIYTINTYTVTFIGYNQEELKVETVEWMKSATAPTLPAVSGYSFDKWDQNFDQVTEDLVVTAKYIEKESLFSCAGINLQFAITLLAGMMFIIIKRKH